MEIFLFILIHNILPVAFIILLGFTLDKKFNLNINTLSKITFYIYIPVYIFVKVYSTALTKEMIKILAFVVLLDAANILVSNLVSRLRHHSKSLKNAFTNSITFYNSANIGIPLITLIFSNSPYIVDGKTPYLGIALTVQIVVLIIQNVTVSTIGYFNASRGSMSVKKSALGILKMPAIYAVPLALILKELPFDFTAFPIWSSCKYLTDGLVSIALITLGAQLSKSKFLFKDHEVYLSNFARLIISPCMAILIIKLLGMSGIYAQTLLIASASPTAVNTALIAMERNNEVSFASQAVMVSTILCAITLAAAVLMARVLFPV